MGTCLVWVGVSSVSLFVRQYWVTLHSESTPGLGCVCATASTHMYDYYMKYMIRLSLSFNIYTEACLSLSLFQHLYRSLCLFQHLCRSLSLCARPGGSACFYLWLAYVCTLACTRLCYTQSFNHIIYISFTIVIFLNSL